MRLCRYPPATANRSGPTVIAALKAHESNLYDQKVMVQTATTRVRLREHAHTFEVSVIGGAEAIEKLCSSLRSRGQMRTVQPGQGLVSGDGGGLTLTETVWAAHDAWLVRHNAPPVEHTAR